MTEIIEEKKTKTTRLVLTRAEIANAILTHYKDDYTHDSWDIDFMDAGSFLLSAELTFTEEESETTTNEVSG